MFHRTGRRSQWCGQSAQIIGLDFRPCGKLELHHPGLCTTTGFVEWTPLTDREIYTFVHTNSSRSGWIGKRSECLPESPGPGDIIVRVIKAYVLQGYKDLGSSP